MTRALFRYSLALLLALLMAPATAQATPDQISFGVGRFDVLENNPRDPAWDLRLEYRWGVNLLKATDPWLAVRPFAGLEVTTDGALYGLGGLVFDIPLGKRIVFSPNFAVGLFDDGNGARGKKMGSLIEFRSTAELAYRFDNDARIGLAFGHISNAGITKHNPGSEIATVYYHMPISDLFGK